MERRCCAIADSNNHHHPKPAGSRKEAIPLFGTIFFGRRIDLKGAPAPMPLPYHKHWKHPEVKSVPEDGGK